MKKFPDQPEPPPLKNRDKADKLTVNWQPWLYLSALALTTALYLHFKTAAELYPVWTLISAFACFATALVLAILSRRAAAPGLKKLALAGLLLFLLGQALLISALVYNYFNPYQITKVSLKIIDIEAVMKDQTKSLDDRVKTAILVAFGDGNPNIANVKNDKDMADYTLSDGEIFYLTSYLNMAVVAGNSQAKPLQAADVKAASKIQDCIDLVSKAIKPDKKP
jgi:hypothetical protein